MKNLFISVFLSSTLLATASDVQFTDQVDTSNKVIHIQEVYKTIDTFKLKIDIFYTNQSFEKENNTAIVFFHGGGWAYGTPSEFFTTCERYAKMGIVTFSVDYRLSIENGVTPSKTISPIECCNGCKIGHALGSGKCRKIPY